jgi:hypothetical protein
VAISDDGSTMSKAASRMSRSELVERARRGAGPDEIPDCPFIGKKGGGGREWREEEMNNTDDLALDPVGQLLLLGPGVDERQPCRLLDSDEGVIFIQL